VEKVVPVRQAGVAKRTNPPEDTVNEDQEKRLDLALAMARDARQLAQEERKRTDLLFEMVRSLMALAPSEQTPEQKQVRIQLHQQLLKVMLE
jgi:hypothetical protein